MENQLGFQPDIKTTLVGIILMILFSMALLDFKLFTQRAQRTYRISLMLLQAPSAIYNELFGGSE